MKRRILLFLTVMIVSLGMAGCSGYSSHYKAVLHVQSHDRDSAFVSFHELDGTEVFKLESENGKKAGIRYSGKLEAGSLTVYYDCGGEKKELFTLQAGEEINARAELPVEAQVFIIIETDGTCRDGACSFQLIYD